MLMWPSTYSALAVSRNVTKPIGCAGLCWLSRTRVTPCSFDRLGERARQDDVVVAVDDAIDGRLADEAAVGVFDPSGRHAVLEDIVRTTPGNPPRPPVIFASISSEEGMSALRSAAVPVCLLAALTIGLAEVDSRAASVTYALVIDEIRDLGVPYRFLSSEAHAINENGAIAGSGENEFGTRRAMFWATPTSNPINLGHWEVDADEAPGHERCRRRGGHEFQAGRFTSRGFRWTQSSGMSDLGLLGTTIDGHPIDGFDAIDINNDGVIIGNTQNRTWNGTGYVLWGTALAVPCPSNGILLSWVRAINDDGYFPEAPAALANRR